MGLLDRKLPLYSLLSQVNLHILYSKITFYNLIQSISGPLLLCHLLQSPYTSLPNCANHLSLLLCMQLLMLTNTMWTFNSSEDFLSFSVTLHTHHTIIVSFLSNFAKSFFHCQGLITVENNTPNTCLEHFTFCAQWKHLGNMYRQKFA